MNDLLKRAKEIRDEVRIGRNTASRVGGLLVDIVGQLGEGGSCAFTDLGGIPNDEFDNVTMPGHYLYAIQSGTGDIKGILVVSNDGDIRQVRYEYDGNYTRSCTDEGWEEWEDQFVLKLRKHIDNDTIYWDGNKRVIKAKGGSGGTYLVTVDVDADSVGKCSVTASGDGVSVSSNANKSQYLVVVPVAGTVTVSVVAIEGYQVQSLTVDNVSKGAINSFTFEDVQKEHSIVVVEEAEENPTEFLVRNDLPGMYYSSTQSVLDALKTDYPNGLTQNVTITCVKTAREKRLSGTYIAKLNEWNQGTTYYLIIDGVDRLVWDGKSLGGVQFKNSDNILLRNISFANCANYGGAYSPNELYAIEYIGNYKRNARNLMVYQCNFNGAYPTDTTKKAWRTIGSKYSDNLSVIGCNISNDYGNMMKLNYCSYVSLIKNDIITDYSLGVVPHPSVMTLKNSYTLISEDNNISGNCNENYFELENVDRLYFRRNNASGGGGRFITMSALQKIKEAVFDSNLFTDMINGPAGAWMKEYINLGTANIDKLYLRNNTVYMNGKYYEQYVTKGGTVQDAYIYNNIAINATEATSNSINGFIINRVKNLHTGNNLYESIRAMLVSPNEDETAGYITLDWTTGRDLTKLQSAGYETNSIKVEDGTNLLEVQNGGDGYKLLTGLEYYSNMSYCPDTDIEYKSKVSTGNTRGCYNLAGISIDEMLEITGYTGEDYSEMKSFSNTAQYSTLADSVLRLKHNSLDRMRIVAFSVIGSQHSEFVLGKSGIIHTTPVLDANGEYEEDELYTINID